MYLYFTMIFNHPFEIVNIAPHRNKNHAQHIDVAPLAISPNQIGLTQPPTRKNLPNCTRMIIDMNPIAHIKPVSIELRTLA